MSNVATISFGSSGTHLAQRVMVLGLIGFFGAACHRFGYSEVLGTADRGDGGAKAGHSGSSGHGGSGGRLAILAGSLASGGRASSSGGAGTLADAGTISDAATMQPGDAQVTPTLDASADAAIDASVGGDAAVGPTGPLIHRWSFDGPSSACGSGVVPERCATDSRGSRHALIYNAVLTGTGTVRFTNADWPQEDEEYFDEDADYVDLGPGLVSHLTDVTVEVWSNWSGQMKQSSLGPYYHPRIFNFGMDDNNNHTEGYLYLTPSAGSGNDPRAAFMRYYEHGVDTVVPTNQRFRASISSGAVAGMQHFAVRMEYSTRRLTLFVNGVNRASVMVGDVDRDGDVDTSEGDVTDWLPQLRDERNWLGRSPVHVDAPFIGEITEFRVYDVALPNADIASSYAAGPDLLWRSDL